MQNFDSEVSRLIAESRGLDALEALRLFLPSETRLMLLDDDLKM